jgi:hypothetical protein
VGCALLVAAQNMPQVWVLREYAVERKNRATGNAKYDADALFEERFADYFTTGEVLGHIGFLNYLSAEFFDASFLRAFGLRAFGFYLFSIKYRVTIIFRAKKIPPSQRTRLASRGTTFDCPMLNFVEAPDHSIAFTWPFV